ncbi:LysR substrate-binding domain-containing protein [Siccirubricoccus sp. KC 17139]|uniref:LysR substrate-binding domain-containing protein n=1 Tax=Siccirubricoccus soli TaxID=2899147 RepID=A0ABT1DDE2_9PROT|nr:LysR substrate-binding domain-containing protein [Siccirubricoccus soli]MCO6419951.1 LysR substrate-binding domain-containing protein [Siccirubricoccus soli]MCP2686086.1 LysR substrate-binding domain-containing protein [Siccirubricoccus soli]
MLAIPPGLDPDLLRSFVLIAEGGSFTRAAQVVGRTQSAVSMQIRRLEETLGQPLLLRGPKGVEPTSHGLWLLERARRLLALHDEIHATFRQPEVAGAVRLGSPDDYAIRWLPGILARFAASHPAVQVDVVCAPSNELVERLGEGELDLTLLSEGNEPPGARVRWLWRGPLLWVGAPEAVQRRPLPLALASASCSWRQAAIAALDAANLPWRMAYTAASLSGSLAVALAGLAVTVAMPSPLPEGLRCLGAEDGLPPLPDFAIGLMRGPGSAVAEALAAHIEEGFRLGPVAEGRERRVA